MFSGNVLVCFSCHGSNSSGTRQLCAIHSAQTQSLASPRLDTDTPGAERYSALKTLMGGQNCNTFFG